MRRWNHSVEIVIVRVNFNATAPQKTGLPRRISQVNQLSDPSFNIEPSSLAQSVIGYFPCQGCIIDDIRIALRENSKTVYFGSPDGLFHC